MNRYPSLRSANVLFLISAVLIVTVGAAVQAWSITWGLILTEILLILAPTLAALRLQKLDWRDTLRLRHWPGWGPVALGLLIGAGLWPLVFILNPVSMLIFGYIPASPFALSAHDPAGLALYFVGLGILPPLCEEVLWRGYILRGYERLSFKASVIIVGLLFAFWHLRLQGLLAILPISFTLAYLARRSNSLLPGVAAHFATNGLTAGLAIMQTVNPSLLTANKAVVTVLGSLVFIGPAAAGVGFWLFRRATRAPADAAQPAVMPQEAWFKPAGVFVVFALIYILFAGYEFVSNRFPEALAGQRLETLSAPWTGPQRWTYEFRDPLNAPVGTAECQLTPTAGTFELACQIHQLAFDTQVTGPFGGSSRYLSDAFERQFNVQYDAATLQLREATITLAGRLGSEIRTVKPADSGAGLVAASNWVSQTLAVPAYGFVPEEWPWRLSALPFERPFFSGTRLTLSPPPRWSGPDSTDIPHTQEAYALVRGQENVSTPAGDFVAWRVTVGDETAWYDVNAPHTLVKYNLYGVTYLLTGR